MLHILHHLKPLHPQSYQLPEDLSIEETLSYISSLPNYDNPELFGMHQNADRTYNEHTSKELVNFLHIFQPSHQLDHGYRLEYKLQIVQTWHRGYSSMS